LARDPQFRPASAGDVAEELAKESGAERLPTTVVQTRHRPARSPRRTFRNPGRIWFAGAVVAIVIALALGLAHIGGGGSSTTKPRPVQVVPPAGGATPADEARNLSRWIRSHSG